MVNRMMNKLLEKVTRNVVKTSCIAALLILASTPASAAPIIINQYASTVLGYSSTWAQWAWDQGNLSAIVYTPEQALGVPDVFAYGENWRSWAPLPMDGTLEYISLGFATPVFAYGVTVRETLGNGFVYQVDVLDTTDVWHTVWTGTDPSPRPTPVSNDSVGTIANFAVCFSTTTPYLVDGVRIRTNTDSILGRWEEIDSVTLHGRAPASLIRPPTWSMELESPYARVPESGSAILLTLGLISLASYRLRQQRQMPKD